jgi:hypothetical protein
MRKTTCFAAAVVACMLPSVVSAGPASPSRPGDGGATIMLVSGGCGLGYHRGPYGGCRPNGAGWRGPPPGYYGGAGAGPRAVVGPYGGAIVCPPGYHLGPQLSACWPN